MKELMEKTFEYYYDQYYSQVYKYICKKVNSVHTAEDLAMESFFSCYKHFNQFNPNKACFATWLYVIVNNKLKNYYRDNKVTDDYDECNICADTFETEIIESTYLCEMRNELYKALQNLSDVQKKIVIFKYFHEKNSSEIAQEIGITSGNVRIQLMRAVDKLREYFDKNNIEWEK